MNSKWQVGCRSHVNGPAFRTSAGVPLRVCTGDLVRQTRTQLEPEPKLEPSHSQHFDQLGSSSSARLATSLGLARLTYRVG